MNPVLRDRLLKTTGAGACAVALALGAWYEGRQYKPYRDPVGIWTVCEGVTGLDVVLNKTYTPRECDTLQTKHLQIAEAAVRRQIKDYPAFSQWRKGALIDFTYNVGEGNLANSTLKKRFDEGDEIAGCKELEKWNKARVKGTLTVLRGLTDRRNAEMELCLGWTTE